MGDKRSLGLNIVRRTTLYICLVLFYKNQNLVNLIYANKGYFMTNLTKQDIQSLMEQARSRLIDYVASKHEVSSLHDTVRSVNTNLQQYQGQARNQEQLALQLIRRTTQVENKMIQMERDMQQLHRIVENLVYQQKVTGKTVSSQSNNQKYVYNQY